MGVIGTALSMSLDGFIAGQDGRGPIPGLPLVVLTHRVPGSVPAGDPPYTFVTDGIGRAVERALVGRSAPR